MSKRSTIDTGTERANTVSGLRSATRGRSTPRAATRARVDKSITKAAMQALQAENAVLRGRIDELEARLFSDVDASASPYPYVYLDAVGRILNLNSTAAAVLGAERSRIIGQPFSSFVAEESRNQFFLHLHACRKSAEATTPLMLQPHNGGTLRHIELISAADAQGTGPVLAHAVILDADRRREAASSLPRRRKRRQDDAVARALRYLKAQQYQLEAQNQRLRATQSLLEESRDRYAMLYEFAPVGYLSFDELGRIQVMNLSAAAMLGADRLHITGKRLADYIVDADLPRFEEHLRECHAGIPNIKSELALKTARGLRVVELISVRSRDEGHDALYRSAILDITERKRAAEALRESEAKLRWLIDNMPAVLWIKDEHGDLQYVSGNVVRVLGYTEQELREGGARFWLNNIHPEDRERVRASFTRVFSGKGGGAPHAYDIEYRRQAKDGSWVWVVDRSMSVSEENGVRYATGMFWDTSRRKRMQEQLRESEERFRQLAEHINDVFFLTNVDGSQLFYVSPTFEKVWGFSAENLYREPSSWQELIHSADRERVRRAVKLRKAASPYDIDFRIRRPTGAVRWIRMRGYPIRDATGRVFRVAGIAADITSRKEAGESLQRSHQRMRELALHLQSVREEERKRIAREIHDELGALLLAIKLDLDACRKTRACGDTAAERTLAELITRADMAIESVRRIATDLRPSILDNVGVLAAVEWQAQDVERRTGIKCEFDADCESDELNVDPDRATAIFRIVQEALANVVRHSGATHVKITLREQAGDVRLEITDNGKGFQVEGPHFPRWGLVGMAERVGSFNGKFEISQARPHGTMVTVFLPAAHARSPAHALEARL